MAHGWLKLVSLIFHFLLVSGYDQNRRADYHELLWVPVYRRRVYMTFLNDVSYPSWLSKKRSHLTLPEGVPFAFACGSCYSPWILPELSLRASVPTSFESVLSPKGEIEHRASRDTLCLISYGLTEPISGSGSIECRMSRSGKVTSETITYSSVKVDRETSPHETIPTTVEDRFAEVYCPNTTMTDKRNIVYVWHFPGKKGILVPSLRKKILLGATEGTYDASCVAYDTKNPTKVWQTLYTIVPPETKSHVLSLETPEEPVKRSRSSVLMIAISSACGILLLIFLFGVIRLLAVWFSMRRNKSTGATRLKQSDTNGHF